MSLDTAILDTLRATLRPRISRAVHKTGLAITNHAAMGAPVDTSALRNSYLSESHMQNDMTFILQDGVQYGIFQELGTSKMPAQPHVIPAVEQGEALFVSEIKAAITL